jgi:hypothetical protein
MPLSDGLPRPDLAADREALSLAWPEIVKRLTEIVGRKLTAYIAGTKDARALDRWINGTEPYGDVEECLRFTHQVVRTLSQHDSPRIVQAWLTGVNPELGDRVPTARPARWRPEHRSFRNLGSCQSLHSRA